MHLRSPRLLWQALLATLWFLPTLMVVASIALAVLLVEVSASIDHEALARWPRLFGASPDGSRDMLATIAGSVITVAGVTFSIVMVAVTQASAQYTPRILRNFMRDRTSQVVLGGLAGVFTYCLVVLRTVRAGDDVSFVPSIAVLVGFVLAIVSIGLLILFIHHMASALQASSIVARVASDTLAAIDHIFPADVGAPASRAAAEDVERLAALAWRPVPAPRAGYVQHVDAEGLLKHACRLDAVVRMERGVGEFVVPGAPLASIARRDTAAPAPLGGNDHGPLVAAFTVAPYRTVEQDPGFGVRQLVDITLKALSPGINDPTTAMTCIDYLATVLARAAERGAEPRFREGEGALRLVARGTTFEQLTDEALDEIRHYAEGHPTVLKRLLDAVSSIARATARPDRRRWLVRHVERIREAVERTVTAPADLAALRERVASARAELSREARAP